MDRANYLMGANVDRYGNEVLSNYFYSDCLIEALKAKIKSPKIRVRKIHQNWTRFPHFIWIDGRYIYEFGTNHSIPCKLIFHGYLRRRPRKAPITK